MLICHLKELREKQSKTLNQFAVASGIRFQTLQNMENGEIRQIPVDVLETICTMLDCNVSDVFEYRIEGK